MTNYEKLKTLGMSSAKIADYFNKLGIKPKRAARYTTINFSNQVFSDVNNPDFQKACGEVLKAFAADLRATLAKFGV